MQIFARLSPQDWSSALARLDGGRPPDATFTRQNSRTGSGCAFRLPGRVQGRFTAQFAQPLNSALSAKASACTATCQVYVCRGCRGLAGYFCVVLMRVGALPIGHRYSDQQLTPSETHTRAPAGWILASLILILSPVSGFSASGSRRTCCQHSMPGYALGLRPRPNTAGAHWVRKPPNCGFC